MINSGTKVTFPSGSIQGQSKILLVVEHKSDSSKMCIIVEETPFHPVDYQWPDQPADKGVIVINGERIPVELCLVAALNKETDDILIDKEIMVKREDPSWYFLVVHVVERSLIEKFGDITGFDVSLEVDKNYRQKLSLVHTLCHLASLAMNKVTNSYWKKAVEQKDSLGNINLDGITVITSRIFEDHSQDDYRVGKSVRKKGFDSERFFNDFKLIDQRINDQLHDWVLNGPLEIMVAPEVSSLTDRREWSCQLPDGLAKIYCGGTHVDILPVGTKFKIMLSKVENEPEFVMEVGLCE